MITYIILVFLEFLRSQRDDVADHVIYRLLYVLDIFLFMFIFLKTKSKCVFSISPPPPALFQIHVRTNLCVDVFIGGSSSIINKDALFGTLGGILHWGIEPCLVCVKPVLYH